MNMYLFTLTELQQINPCARELFQTAGSPLLVREQQGRCRVLGIIPGQIQQNSSMTLQESQDML
jgi:hypothetical protein